MEKHQSRLEAIRQYDEELYKVYKFNSSKDKTSVALAEGNINCYYNERLFSISVITNLIFLAIISILIIGMTSINTKYIALTKNFNNLNTQYMETRDEKTSVASTENLIEATLDISNTNILEVSQLTLTGQANTNEEYISTENEKNIETEVVEEVIERELNLTDITRPSNLTADELNEIIELRLGDINKGTTKITNIGEALVNMEKEYNVNALLCLAIGSLESGHGTSAAAINKNNLFGLMGKNGLMTFNSVEECINYWGGLIRNKYIDSGRTTIESIQKKYCPNSTTWSSNIYYLMNEYATYVKN